MNPYYSKYRLFLLCAIALFLVPSAKAEGDNHSSVVSWDYTFAVRANLLRWATLTPDLGVEWRFKPHWSCMVNASYTSWSWDNSQRNYGLTEIAVEARRYLGKRKRGYVGLMVKGGDFCYKLSAIGKQGEICGGGITFGYNLPLSEVLSFDFSAGVGYVYADCERFYVVDRVRVRADEKRGRNWCGPISAGVTLSWILK